MFGRKSKGFVQMYEYGCRHEPVTGLKAALWQMGGRVQLWNRFVEIEREIGGRTQLLSDESEQREICDLRTRIASLRASILQLRKTDGENPAAIEDHRN
jgi:hypothetical protein